MSEYNLPYQDGVQQKTLNYLSNIKVQFLIYNSWRRIYNYVRLTFPAQEPHVFISCCQHLAIPDEVKITNTRDDNYVGIGKNYVTKSFLPIPMVTRQKLGMVNFGFISQEYIPQILFSDYYCFIVYNIIENNNSFSPV